MKQIFLFLIFILSLHGCRNRECYISKVEEGSSIMTFAKVKDKVILSERRNNSRVSKYTLANGVLGSERYECYIDDDNLILLLKTKGTINTEIHYDYDTRGNVIRAIERNFIGLNNEYDHSAIKYDFEYRDGKLAKISRKIISLGSKPYDEAPYIYEIEYHSDSMELKYKDMIAEFVMGELDGYPPVVLLNNKKTMSLIKRIYVSLEEMPTIVKIYGYLHNESENSIKITEDVRDGKNFTCNKKIYFSCD